MFSNTIAAQKPGFFGKAGLLFMLPEQRN